MLSEAPIKAPFPYFGGKQSVMADIWDRLGDPVCFVDPFCGSAASILCRPNPDPDRHVEHINDIYAYIPNFYRAVQHDPDAVAAYANYPAMESDLHARHAWLVGQRDGLREKLEGDPGWYDTKIAGWWVWGMALWLGSGFCSGDGPWQSVGGKLVNQGDRGRGIKRLILHQGDRGLGIKASRGVDLIGYMQVIADRFHRGVTVNCGDWQRVLKPAVCWGLNENKRHLTGVLLDPPYSHAERDSRIYAEDHDVDSEVRQWALDNGNNKYLRIAYCTYSDPDCESRFPAAGWSAYRWKAQGGYGNNGAVSRANSNKGREVIWFSPYCLRVGEQLGLFEPHP